MKNILHIPCNLVEAQISALKLEDVQNFGATSVPMEYYKNVYSECIRIPWVTEASFKEYLIEIIQRLKIDEIHVYNMSIFNEIAEIEPSKTSNKVSPYTKSENSYYIDTAKSFIRIINSENIVSWKLSELQLASLFKNFTEIPGQCSQDKFLSLLNCCQDSAEGDFIEIGSFYGKSAFLLGWYASTYKRNKFLSIDPWHTLENFQVEANEKIKHTSCQINLSNIHSEFITNTWSLIYGSSNYIVGYSSDAFKKFIKSMSVHSHEFGTIDYTGNVSLLHIDGNHDYKYVKSDIEEWGSLLISGGWIIIDDYNWCYGDGPKKAADELLMDRADEFSEAFFSGGALFLKKK